MSKRRAYGSGSIRVEKRANGKQVYCGQFSVDGVQYERVLGEVRRPHSDIGITKREAERMLRERRAAVEAGADTGRRGKREAQAKYAASARTLQAVADEHLRLLEGKGRKANTTDEYAEMVKRTLAPFFPQESVAQITHHDVQRFVDHMRELPPVRKGMARGRSNGTILNHLNLLHAILATAVRRGYAPDNVVDRIDNRPSADDQSDEITYLLMEEVDAVIRALKDDHLRVTMEAIILTAATTGLRQGELRALRWRDVDFVASKVRVERSYSGGRETTPKSRKSRRAVPMTTRLARLLAMHSQRTAYATDDDLVFPHPHKGTHLSDTLMRDNFQQACKAAGVRVVRFHDLRHSYGTMMAAAGTPLRSLQGLMGHASYATTERYAKWAPDVTGELALAERAFSSSEATEPAETFTEQR